ncbi:hypothetical protein NL676_024023 [Syzygium grande]|nr:hypothetical protein NL676_024023 [Syzygium grande]
MSLLLHSLLLLSLSFLARATVPPSAQFKFANEGEFGPYLVEYGGYYRTTSIFNSPSQLCFYNTTPDAFTLTLRMATTRSESQLCWVWEAKWARTRLLHSGPSQWLGRMAIAHRE